MKEPLNDKTEEENHTADIIDEDLYEEIDDEEMLLLVQQARIDTLKRERERKEALKSKPPFPKWAFWLIAVALVMNVFTFMPQKISIPAIDFLIASAKLSQDTTIQTYKEAVVTIETGDSRGTGFSIHENGIIITNHHVVDDAETVQIGFPENGLYEAEVIERFPKIDTAILKVDGSDLPYLEIDGSADVQQGDHVYFIGNPLSFNGIANEGNVIGYTELSSWEDPVGMIEAPIYRGNSGSPIINEDGKVIGVVFATIKDEDHGKVGLYVPIEVIQLYYNK
ncbi:MAG TPA: serine protease [Bacillota bacterium]|nr:serine protease [Bacillota bacterium]